MMLSQGSFLQAPEWFEEKTALGHMNVAWSLCPGAIVGMQQLFLVQRPGSIMGMQLFPYCPNGVWGPFLLQ